MLELDNQKDGRAPSFCDPLRSIPRGLKAKGICLAE